MKRKIVSISVVIALVFATVPALALTVAAAEVPSGQIVVLSGNVTVTSHLVGQESEQATYSGNLSINGTDVDGVYNLNVKYKLLDTVNATTCEGFATITAYVTTDATTHLGYMVLWGSAEMDLCKWPATQTIEVDPTADSMLTLKPELEGFVVCDNGDLIVELVEVTPLSTVGELVASGVDILKGLLDNFMISVNIGDTIHPFHRPLELTNRGESLVNGLANIISGIVELFSDLCDLLFLPE